MNEQDAAYSFIRSLLVADGTLNAVMSNRWYRHIAPQGSVFPFGIMTKVGGRDTRGVGQYRVLTELRIDVKIVTKAGTDHSASVGRMDALLDVPSQASPITSVVLDGVTYWIHGCSRREPISYAELDQGVIYEHAGGTYDLTISR